MFLQCNDVVKKYISKTAVNGISMNVECGNVIALLGPNGSGKTTLMKMIAGLTKPTQGTILFKGEEVGASTKAKIAYMSTEPYFYRYMNILDVGKYYNDFFDDFDMNYYIKLLDRMELAQKDKAYKLSSGMMAKLKIAVTIARKAELYMLDEPLNGIDIIARDLIIDLINETKNQNSTIMLSSHLVDELEKIMDYAVFMKQGMIVLGGQADQLRAQHNKSIVDMYREVYAHTV